MDNIIVLGVSGSIGTQSVDIIKQSENKQLLGFSFFTNLEYARHLLNEFSSVKYVSTTRENVEILKSEYKEIIFFTNLNDLAQVKCDLVVVATVGFSALEPTLHAIKSGNDIALANKECIVAGGNLLFKEIKRFGVKVFTIDSELNAIEQCLNGENHSTLKRIILTASGGPFLNKSLDELNNISIDKVTDHPNWKMGVKISIDSANLCNKMLEVIETSYYFDIDIKNIEIVIQPSSMIHSMVEFVDNSIIMQMSNPSMRLPISYAINKEKRYKINNYESVDFSKLNRVEFKTPTIDKFPILELLNIFDKNKPYLFIAFNALNEYFNYLFRNDKIKFLDISNNIIKEIKNIKDKEILNLEDVFDYNQYVINLMEEKYGFNFKNN